MHTHTHTHNHLPRVTDGIIVDGDVEEGARDLLELNSSDANGAAVAVTGTAVGGGGGGGGGTTSGSNRKRPASGEGAQDRLNVRTAQRY